MPRWLKLAFLLIGVAVVAGLVYLQVLHRRVQQLGAAQPSEEQARREVTQPPITTATDVKVTAKIFWASPQNPAQLAPVQLELPLSADAVQRSRQLVRALVDDVPSPAQRTLPADTALLEFYVLSDGTGVADFSDALASETPSGILTEQMAVDSIRRTLENNVPSLLRLKILIHGQEAETLAGHVDLTGFFALHPPGAAASPGVPQTGAQPAPSAKPELTPPKAPGKLKP